jgi:hypothetical protein
VNVMAICTLLHCKCCILLMTGERSTERKG